MPPVSLPMEEFMSSSAFRRASFTAATTRSSNYYKRFCYLYIRIGAVALIAYYYVYICRVSLCKSVLVNSDASALQLVHKHIYRRCVLISCYNHAVDFEVVLSEYVDEPHNLKVVCNSEVLSRLVGCNVS